MPTHADARWVIGGVSASQLHKENVGDGAREARGRRSARNNPTKSGSGGGGGSGMDFQYQDSEPPSAAPRTMKMAQQTAEQMIRFAQAQKHGVGRDYLSRMVYISPTLSFLGSIFPGTFIISGSTRHHTYYLSVACISRSQYFATHSYQYGVEEASRPGSFRSFPPSAPLSLSRPSSVFVSDSLNIVLAEGGPMRVI